MRKRSIDLTISLLAFVGLAPTTASAQSGTAVVRVVTEPPGLAADFEFVGVPSGSVAAGGNLEATAIGAGSYTTTQAEAGTQWLLVAIDCDDGRSRTPSVGDLASRRATINVDAGETVTCTFVQAAREPQQSTREPQQSSSGGGPSGGETNPFTNPDDGFDKFPWPDELPAVAGTFPVPKDGPWDVSNHSGQMACGPIRAPLRPERGRGRLEVRETVIGTGMAEGTAPLTMSAVPAITGRYAGSVGGSQDGIPMTIEFFWQLVTDEWIIGYLTSSVSANGMSCNMFRTFELEYTGP